MLAYMNQESWAETIPTGRVVLLTLLGSMLKTGREMPKIAPCGVFTVDYNAEVITTDPRASFSMFNGRSPTTLDHSYRWSTCRTHSTLVFGACALIPKSLHALLAFALAGWCSILPVLAQACPCYSARSGISVCCDSGQPAADPAPARKTCCASCVARPVEAGPELAIAEIRPDHSEDQPRNCRCDQPSEFQLFRAQLSDPEWPILCTAQPLNVLVAWPDPPVQTEWVSFRRSVHPHLDHQQKLSTLGVWRL